MQLSPAKMQALIIVKLGDDGEDDLLSLVQTEWELQSAHSANRMAQYAMTMVGCIETKIGRLHKRLSEHPDEDEVKAIKMRLETLKLLHFNSQKAAAAALGSGGFAVGTITVGLSDASDSAVTGDPLKYYPRTGPF